MKSKIGGDQQEKAHQSPESEGKAGCEASKQAREKAVKKLHLRSIRNGSLLEAAHIQLL
jgi:hypothetical protein